MAAATERILLGTAVLLLPYYHPVLLAKQLATRTGQPAGRDADGRRAAGPGPGGTGIHPVGPGLMTPAAPCPTAVTVCSPARCCAAAWLR